MRFIVVIVLLVLLSCNRDYHVQISGRVVSREGTRVDSVVVVQVNDENYSFRLDENWHFAGEIKLERESYASVISPFYGMRVPLYLSPGEDLEIILEPRVAQFRGSLGAINTYLKEQGEVGMGAWNEYYALDDTSFVKKMNELIDSKILMLEAKNLGTDFNALERERIRYLVVSRAFYYPQNHLYDSLKGRYAPGQEYHAFMSSFSLDNEAMMSWGYFRNYLLNVFFLKLKENHIKAVVNLILEQFKSQKIKTFLLSSLAYHYILNHGLTDADYLLAVCRKEIADPSKYAMVEQLVDRWRKLSPGTTAPDIQLVDMEGNETNLRALKGSYLFIMIWPFEYISPGNMFDSFRRLEEIYKEKNVRFLALTVTGGNFKQKWSEKVKQEQLPGEHFFVTNANSIYHSYVITSYPYYLFVDPYNRILQAKIPDTFNEMESLFRGAGL